MNNRPDDRTRLLAETLDGEWATGPAAAMARRAAALARRRRAVRQVSLPLVAVIAMGAVLVFRPHPPSTIASSRPMAATPSIAAPLGYEIISDEELIATLRDRPLLVLPQENGPKKIVLLER